MRNVIFIAFLLVAMILFVGGCKKPDKVLPYSYKAYSPDNSEKVSAYGLEFFWER
jgi:hypothetical protein